MKFRFHRGLLDESMETVVEVADLAALRRLLDAKNEEMGIPVYDTTRLEVKYYCFDDRIGWDTHVVTTAGMAIGFLNGPLGEGT